MKPGPKPQGYDKVQAVLRDSPDMTIRAACKKAGVAPNSYYSFCRRHKLPSKGPAANTLLTVGDVRASEQPGQTRRRRERLDGMLMAGGRMFRCTIEEVLT